MELPLFDPASISLQEMKVNVEAVEEMKAGEGLVPVYKVRESFSGIDGTSWISPRLGTLKASGPMGFTFIKETKEQALNMKVTAPPDIIALTAVQAEGEVVADPRRYIVYESEARRGRPLRDDAGRREAGLLRRYPFIFKRRFIGSEAGAVSG